MYMSCEVLCDQKSPCEMESSHVYLSSLQGSLASTCLGSQPWHLITSRSTLPGLVRPCWCPQILRLVNVSLTATESKYLDSLMILFRGDSLFVWQWFLFAGHSHGLILFTLLRLQVP